MTAERVGTITKSGLEELDMLMDARMQGFMLNPLKGLAAPDPEPTPEFMSYHNCDKCGRTFTTVSDQPSGSDQGGLCVRCSPN